jgi:hypothetical protein
MGLHYGVLRAQPDRAQRNDGVRRPHLTERTSRRGSPVRRDE